MKVGQSTSVGAPRSVGRVRRTSLVSSVDETSSVDALPNVQNSASLFGIPPEEMTPKVRSAIMTLLHEVEVLREEVESAARRLEELEQLADLDPLAPVANRRAFVRDLSRMMSYCKRYDVPASMLYFDVNDLKRINDEYGHAGGDTVLIHVANTLVTNTRESDIVGRLGGDEFAVLLAQASEDQALEKGAQLANAIASAPIRFNGKDIAVNVAFGAYTFEPHEKPTEVLDNADKRMYANKRGLKEKL